MLGEGQASDATIKALSGHISNKMLERYSHSRNAAKQEAISVFDTPGRVDSPEIHPKWNEGDSTKVQ